MQSISCCFDRINEKIYSGALKIEKIEDGVIDENWYSEYKNLFQNDPQATSWVKRLCLTYKKDDWGICNLRPIRPRGLNNHMNLSSDISETYMLPPEHMTKDNGYFMKCCCDTNAYSKQINCVPFIMPNPYFGMCAQASVWIALKCLEHKRNLIVKSASIPEIQKAATGHCFSDSEGLEFKNMTRLLKMNNCEAFVYDTALEPFKSFSFEKMYNIIYAYVESGLPVIIGVDVNKLPWWDNYPPGYHSIVLIGHTINKESGVDGFILHDESKYPYLEIKKEALKKAWDIPDKNKECIGISKEISIRKAVVGAPPSVKVGYEVALSFSSEILNSLYMDGSIDKKEYPVRPMLIKGEDFLKETKTWGFNEPSFKDFLMKRIKKVDFPQFVWLLQLHEEEAKRTERKIIGIIVFSGITRKLLLLSIEDKLILYFNAKNNKYQKDYYPK